MLQFTTKEIKEKEIQHELTAGTYYLKIEHYEFPEMVYYKLVIKKDGRYDYIQIQNLTDDYIIRIERDVVADLKYCIKQFFAGQRKGKKINEKQYMEQYNQVLKKIEA